MMVEKKIDYLQFSCDHYPTEIIPDDKVEKSFMRFYETMQRCKSGATIHAGNPNTTKYLVQISGGACDNLRGDIGLNTLVEDWLHLGAKFSRVDWCITQFIDEDGLITNDYISELYRMGELSGAWFNYAPKTIKNEATQQSETTVYGDWKKRSKKGLMRVYDKGVDLDLEKYLITRIECEERQNNAQTSIKRYIEKDLDIGSVIKSRVSSNDDYWNQVIDAPTIDISRGKQIDDNDDKRLSRWVWLNNQVAPAIAQAIIDDQNCGLGHENWFDFLSEIKKQFNRKMKDHD